MAACPADLAFGKRRGEAPSTSGGNKPGRGLPTGSALCGRITQIRHGALWEMGRFCSANVGMAGQSPLETLHELRVHPSYLEMTSF